MIYANYIPDTSELAFALSLTLLGALQDFTEARNVDQALSRELFQSVRAAFADLENAAQAAFAAARISLVVVSVYACARALARALYALVSADVKVDSAVPIACSRTPTAVPTHAIFEDAADVVAVPDAGEGEVAANAGAAAASNESATMPAAIFFFMVLFFSESKNSASCHRWGPN